MLCQPANAASGRRSELTRRWDGLSNLADPTLSLIASAQLPLAKRTVSGYNAGMLALIHHFLEFYSHIFNALRGLG